MTDLYDSEQAEIIRHISDVLEHHGYPALEGRAAEQVAEEWLDAGFADPEEVDDWVRARCFKADSAHALEMAGITPAQAAIRTTQGTAEYEDTIGYKYARDDLSIDEAKRIVASDFWNS